VINWESSLDGLIGIGKNVLTNALSGGTHTITANVSDRHLAQGCASLEIYVINIPPLANDDSATLDEGGTAVIDLVANDSDVVEGLDLASITIIEEPGNGSLIVNTDGTVYYSHNGSESTSDSFAYTVSDTAGEVSNAAIVSITVQAVNDTPVANSDIVTLLIGESVIITLTENDIDPDDGLDLTSIKIISDTTTGTLEINSDGTVTYTHDGGVILGDGFSYTIRDVSGQVSNTASVVINIQDPNAYFPILVDYESGLPSAEDGWTYYSSNPNYGRIQSIDGRLRMDVTTNGYYNLNEAVLEMDMTGVQSARLSFFQADLDDESSVMPETFVGHNNSDGIAISLDGNTWYCILDSSQLEVSTSGQTYSINLDDAISSIRSQYDAGFGYSSSFKIKFQQYDNYAYPTDGREWDNIAINVIFDE
jgi:hypothetical protein